jgi:predicted DNA-binding protein
MDECKERLQALTSEKEKETEEYLEELAEEKVMGMLEIK